MALKETVKKVSQLKTFLVFHFFDTAVKKNETKHFLKKI